MRSNVVKITVNQEETGIRADKFLSLKSGMSRTRIAGLIETGNVELDGRMITDISQKVKSGQVFFVKIPPIEPLAVKPADILLDILYEDEDIIVIDKPPGLVVHPAAGHRDDTLVNALLHHCNDLSGIGGVERPGIVHRLDKGTSGLMVVAKNDNAHIGLSRQFAEHKVEKLYKALVYGTFRPPSGTIVGNIGRSPKNRQKMAILKSGGKEAVTGYRTLASYFAGDLSLVECRLETGRTHQIRVHLSQNGHSIVGDQLYGGGTRLLKNGIPAEVREALKSLDRQALHAYKIAFSHPVSGQNMVFEASLPKDIEYVINVIKSYC